MRDAAATRGAVQHYNSMVEAVKKGEKAYTAKHMENSGDEAQAWLDYAEGKNDDAIRLMRSVADKQDAKGKGEVELPAREMLADILLKINRPKEALVEYEASMKIDPNRLHAVSGAAHAAELAHDEAKAKQYAERLPAVVKP
jgi:tetratricopeptide (TPR) repeat protein